MTLEEIVAELKAIVDKAEADGRELTDEEVARYESLEGDLQKRQRTEAIQKRQQAYDTVQRSAIPAASVAVSKGDDTLERAFDHYLRTGQQNSDIVELRAQSTSGSAGGYMVPEGFRNQMVERMKAFGGLAENVETITTESGNPLPWPTLDDTGNVGEIVAENGTFAGGADLTFGEASLGAYKFMAGGASQLPLRVSVELLQDAAFDVQALVSRKLGERIARIQATQWVKGAGSGSSAPLGIVTGKTGVEPAAAAITYADLLKFVHSVDPAYRDQAKWSFNDASLAYLRGLVDDNNRPLWQPSAEAGLTGLAGGSLLGYPVVIDQAFDNMSLANDGVNWGVFGDLREAYVIRKVKDVQIVVDPYTRAANGQVQFTAWARADGTVQNPNAYVALTGYEAA
jgi:HK97 family phage major capsid protein